MISEALVQNKLNEMKIRNHHLTAQVSQLEDDLENRDVSLQ
jgi:hypothetical protein